MGQAEHRLPDELFLTIDRAGPVPLYFQIAKCLERAITEGSLPPGSRLENELSLAERLGFSRPTIRRAIQELVDRGLLVRRRGVGTQVVHSHVNRNVELSSLYEDLDADARTPTTRVLSSEIVPAGELAVEQLGVEPGRPTLHIRRLRYADGVPLAILDNILPEPFIAFDERALTDHGLYQLLRSRGVTLRVAKQRIGARQATAEESRLLDLAEGAAVLTMSRTAFDNSGRAVEFGQHSYRSDLYSFEVTLVDR
ncbi:GntR family transcriptional regulator [Agromyces aerolatus]|uniref:GntR family transcriptional regulator n=1 Tax=Agromyces sp. LY-1074 TaxID=3074080 RepID=UPI002864704F|nr:MULTISPECIES: GntR family transcriptional regulator [unclassified Agromyces]MDR5699247.1 GntR family transcriptional regulator [Agromyces sp. LY-1074]MDR5705543.1 GntR family transcriptional regulator [Agromyces sp. LY-1358]